MVLLSSKITGTVVKFLHIEGGKNMNQRQRRMLLYLLSQKHYQPIQSICQEFGFSEKTIRNDIKAINSYLNRNSVNSFIEAKRGSGVRMQLQEQEEEYVRYILESRVLEIKPDLDRFYHGMILLLFTQDVYTMDTLADELYTNRLQLKEDLQCWESMLRMFQLKIEKGTHLHIAGEEQQIRLFVLYYFYQHADKAMIMSIEPVFLQEHKALFRRILHIYEEAYQQRFTANALHHFSIYLGIMMKRIQMGHGLRDAVCYKGNETVHRLLQEYFHMDVNALEMQFLEQMIESGARQWNRSMLHNFALTKETKELANRFFNGLVQEYGPLEDEELPVLFSILLQTAILRRQHGMRVLHYHDTQVKYDSMAECLCVMRLFHRDAALQALQLYESEYTRLSMLLLPYFHQLKKTERFRAGLIVNCSLELAYYGRMRITEAIGQIDIARILTEDEIDAAADEVDFFITFDYLHQRVPNVEISSMIQDSDIQKLQLYLKQLRQSRAMKQPIPCTHHRRHAENEDALHQLLYQKLHDHCTDMSFHEFVSMLAMHRLLLQDCMLIVLYDARISASFISMLELKKQLYIEGKAIRQVCLAGFAVSGYEHLQEDIIQLKEQLKKLLPHLT